MAKEWAEFQHRRAQGDFRPDPLAGRFPSWAPAVAPEQAPAPAAFSITDAFKLWERDHLANGKSERTTGDFRHKLNSLAAFVGHDDAREVTPENVADWCEHLAKMIRQLPRGPIFLTPAGDPAAKARAVSGRVGEWVREVVKIEDPRVQPNHAWRHRFKTVARDVDIAPEYVDAIQGHEDGRASSDYGETTIRALWREFRNLP